MASASMTLAFACLLLSGLSAVSAQVTGLVSVHARLVSKCATLSVFKPPCSGATVCRRLRWTCAHCLQVYPFSSSSRFPPGTTCRCSDHLSVCCRCHMTPTPATTALWEQLQTPTQLSLSLLMCSRLATHVDSASESQTQQAPSQTTQPNMSVLMTASTAQTLV